MGNYWIGNEPNSDVSASDAQRIKSLIQALEDIDATNLVKCKDDLLEVVSVTDMSSASGGISDGDIIYTADEDMLIDDVYLANTDLTDAFSCASLLITASMASNTSDAVILDAASLAALSVIGKDSSALPLLMQEDDTFIWSITTHETPASTPGKVVIKGTRIG